MIVRLVSGGIGFEERVTVEPPFLVHPKFEAETRALVAAQERGHRDARVTSIISQPSE